MERTHTESTVGTCDYLIDRLAALTPSDLAYVIAGGLLRSSMPPLVVMRTIAAMPEDDAREAMVNFGGTEP